MPVTNVTSVWSSGRLVFQGSTGAEIGYWDGVNRKFVLTSGANFDFSAATGSITLAGGEIAEADLASNIVSSDKMSPKVIKAVAGAWTAIATSSSAPLFGWDNPESGTIIVNQLWVQIDTAASSSGSLFIGAAATSSGVATTVEATLGATGLQSPIGSTGSFIVSSTQWVTGWVGDASSGCVGDYYFTYFEMTT